MGTAPSAWKTIDQRHRAGILLGAAVVLAVAVAAAVALAGRDSGGEIAGGDTSRTITPAEETSAPAVLEPSYEVTSTAESTSTSGAGGTSVPATSAAPSGAESDESAWAVAYRREGWLCVAAANGTGEQRVAESASGVFSLSPDGATLASVDADGHLRLYNVATGEGRDLGPMEPERPSWSPDSASVAYTAPGPTVRRMARRGGRQAILFDGRVPVYARNSATIVAASPSSGKPAVLIWRDDTLERQPVDAAVTSVACNSTRIYFGTAPAAGAPAALRSMSISGADERTEVRAAGAGREVSIGSLLLSPDGAWICYAEQGDDGYSRVFALPTAGGAAVSLSGRRDAYPLCWSADSRTLYLIDGNALQGDSTALVAVTPADGLRRTLVEGAGL